nr:transposase [Candidatus Enterovibrio escacola]
MLQKRFIIETIFDQLKNISQIEYLRHRNCIRFIVNLLAGLIVYLF